MKSLPDEGRISFGEMRGNFFNIYYIDRLDFCGGNNKGTFNYIQGKFEEFLSINS